MYILIHMYDLLSWLNRRNPKVPWSDSFPFSKMVYLHFQSQPVQFLKLQLLSGQLFVSLNLSMVKSDKLTSTSYPKARQAKLHHSPAISGADNHTKVTASDLSPAMLCSSSWNGPDVWVKLLAIWMASVSIWDLSSGAALASGLPR